MISPEKAFSLRQQKAFSLRVYKNNTLLRIDISKEILKPTAFQPISKIERF